MSMPISVENECILRLPDGTVQWCGEPNDYRIEILQRCIEHKASEADLAILAELPVLDVNESASPETWSFPFAVGKSHRLR